MPDRPFFSIIIPTYNRADLINETIDSFIAQQFPDFELIIVDDGSTDNTEEVISTRFATDSRIKYFSKQNGERGAARNFGIKKATGQFISFIDSDDIAYPDALQMVYEKIQSKNDLNCLAAGYEIKDKSTSAVLSSVDHSKGLPINQQLLKGNVLSCIGIFIRASLLQQFYFEEDRKFAGTEDWLLWLQLAARYDFVCVPGVFFCMWQHNSRSVMSFSEEKLVYRCKMLKKKLEADQEVIKKYGQKKIDQIYAHQLSYTALHLAMSKNKRKAFYYLWQAAKANSKEAFSRRTLGIFKNILLRW